MGVGEVPVRVGDRLERVATRAPDHRRAELIAEPVHRVEREVAQQALESVDVGVERLAADAQARGQPGEGERLDARLVDQLTGRFDDGIVVEPHLRGHVPPSVVPIDSLTR